VSTPHPIRLEVAAIQRENAPHAGRLRRDDERRIGEVHLPICVHLHQLERPVQRRLVAEPDRQRTDRHEITERLRPAAGGLQDVKGFRQNGDGCLDRLLDALQRHRTAVMLVVLGVEQGDERPRVDENHRRRFRRASSAFRTPSRVLVDGAIA